MRMRALRRVRATCCLPATTASRHGRSAPLLVYCCRSLYPVLIFAFLVSWFDAPCRSAGFYTPGLDQFMGLAVPACGRTLRNADACVAWRAVHTVAAFMLNSSRTAGARRPPAGPRALTTRAATLPATILLPAPSRLPALL